LQEVEIVQVRIPEASRPPGATRRRPSAGRGWSAGVGCWWTGAVVVLAVACAPPPASEVRKRPLRIALHGDPSTLDPHLQAEAIAHSVLGNVYESLVTFDAEMRLRPSLVESWENPDDLVWRFHLRPGVRFHDGRPLTTADVVASFERARSLPDSKSGGALVAVAEVRALDELDFEIRTVTPVPILLNKLAFFFIVPADVPALIRHPVGTGPYRFVAYAGDRVRLAAFAEHWRGPPPEPEVELWFVSDSGERLRALLAGDIDLAGELAPEDAAALAAADGFRVESRSSLAVTYLQMNPGVAPFADPRVRQAVDLALDRERLVAEILNGQGQPVGQMVSPDIFGFAPDLAPVRRDLDAARRLLAAAGFGGGLDVVLEARDGRETAPVREQLAAAGIRAEVVTRPWSEMYSRLQSGAVDFYLGSWVCSPGDASDLLDQKIHRRDPGRGYGSSNSNAYSQPEIDRLIEDSGKLLDMAQRRRLLQSALRAVAEDRAFLPLYTPYVLYGVRREVEWVPRQDEQIKAFEVRR
jgi:peptide/nickel transport system substrate-binding protein